MGKFIYFTEAQKERAASVDLESFLRQQGEKLLLGQLLCLILKFAGHLRQERRLFRGDPVFPPVLGGHSGQCLFRI